MEFIQKASYCLGQNLESEENQSERFGEQDEFEVEEVNENNQNDNEDACFICYDRPKQVALISCGHRTCEQCSLMLLEHTAENQANCPMCRQPIIETLLLR